MIVVENRGVPLVTIEADVKNGSFTQGPEFEGLSHLYEHMFFKANARYPNPDDFVARASELGAEFNGTTSEERVNYYLTVPADSVEGGMNFLAAALINPLFRKDELEREREVVIGEYDRNESSPFFPFSTAMSKALWSTGVESKEPARRAGGDSEHDAGEDARDPAALLRPEQHGDHHHRRRASCQRRSRSPMRFSAAGSRSADPFEAEPIPPIPPLTRDTAVIVEQPIGTVVVMLQWQGPSARQDPAATYAADVFSDVLNQPGFALPAPSRRQRPVSLGQRELLHAEPGRTDHHRRGNVAGKIQGRACRAAR